MRVHSEIEPFQFSCRLAVLLVVLIPMMLLTPLGESEDKANFTADSLFFADFHNSVLQRLYWHRDLRGLDDESWPVSISGLHTVRNKLIFMSIGLPEFELGYPDTACIEGVIGFLRSFAEQCGKTYPSLCIARNGDEAVRIIRSGKTAVFLAVEGTSLLHGSVRWLDSLHSVGVTMVTMAHHFENEFLTSQPNQSSKHRTSLALGLPLLANDRSRLTPEGRTFVKRIVRLGMFLDISHLGEDAFWQVLEITRGYGSVVASHSNAKALCNSSRNLSDAQLKAIAASGGLVGVCLHSPMLSQSADASISDIVNHIDHMIKVMGADHIALGTDLEGRIKLPKELYTISDVQKITDEMSRKGFSDNVIKKIMWKNLLTFVSSRL